MTKFLSGTSEADRHLDRFELIAEIASGGMATVYLARLSGVGGFQRFVAIKRLHPHLAGDEEFVQMFLDEARLAARLHHPNVVPILEIGMSPQGYYLVMEYVEGDTLARILARSAQAGRMLPPQVSMRVCVDSLQGLHVAHEMKDDDGQPLSIVHRDVSPQNILIGMDGSARITDFGVARATTRLSTTRTGQLKGKLAYMAPEQAKGAEVDRRADVFAMGIVIWECLAQKRLFKGEGEADTLNRVLYEPIPSLKQANPDVPDSLEHIVMKALDRDASKRFPTASDLGDALEKAALAANMLGTHKDVAAHVESVLGTDISAQRDAVRAWIARSEPSQRFNASAIPMPVPSSSSLSSPGSNPNAANASGSLPRLNAQGVSSVSSAVIQVPTQAAPAPTALAAMELPPRRRTGVWIAAGAAGVLLVVIAAVTLSSKKPITATQAPLVPTTAASSVATVAQVSTAVASTSASATIASASTAEASPSATHTGHAFHLPHTGGKPPTTTATTTAATPQTTATSAPTSPWWTTSRKTLTASAPMSWVSHMLGHHRRRWFAFGILGVAVALTFACVSTQQTVDPRFLALHNAFSAIGLAQVGPVQQGSLAEGREARLSIICKRNARPSSRWAAPACAISTSSCKTKWKRTRSRHDARFASGRARVRRSRGHVHDARAHGGGLRRFSRSDMGWKCFRLGTCDFIERDCSGTGQGTCASPIPLAPGIVTGSTAHGESENECTTDTPGCSSASDGPEMVYRIDIPSQKRLLLELDARYDAILYVRKEDCTSQDAEVKCNDDDNNNAMKSRIDTVVEAGTYYVFVDSYSRASGGYKMTVTVQDVPQLADVCRQARAISAGTTTNGTLHGAFDLAQGTCTSEGPDVPYRLDLTQKMRARITMESTDFEPVVHVRKTCTDEHSEIGCFDQTTGTSGSNQAVFTGVLDPGSLSVFADSSAEAADGQFTLQAELAPESGTGGTGDGCTDAIPLTTSTTASGDTFDVKDDISGKCTAPGAPDVVYRIDLARRSRIRARISAEEGKNDHQRGHVLVLQKTCADKIERDFVRGIGRSSARAGHVFHGGRRRDGKLVRKIRSRVHGAGRERARDRVQIGAGADRKSDGQRQDERSAESFRRICGGEGRLGASGDRVHSLVVRQRSTVSLVLSTPGWDGLLALRRVCLDPTGSSGAHAAEISCNNDSEDAQHSRITPRSTPERTS